MTEKPEYTYPRHVLNERQIGNFERSFTFPMEVNSDDMKASLANGLLRIVVPKLSDVQSRTKRINIV
jgi:HSP20 family protein